MLSSVWGELTYHTLAYEAVFNMTNQLAALQRGCSLQDTAM